MKGESLVAYMASFTPRVRCKRLILMLTAYIDDSGSEPSGPVFVLAGLIAPYENWQKFAEEWEAKCAEHPSTPNFHMNEAWSIDGGYWDACPDKVAARDERLVDLASIVKKYAVARVHSAMSWRAYEDIAKGKVGSDVDSPYFWLHWKLIFQIIKWQRERGKIEKVSFIFDDQARLGKRAAFWWDHVRDVVPETLDILTGTPHFEHDDVVIQLKSADMLAWHLRRKVAFQINGTPEPRAFGELLESIPNIGAAITSSDLFELVDSYLQNQDMAK